MIHITRKQKLPESLTPARIKKIAGTTFEKTGKSGDSSIVFTGDHEIQLLNNEYRQIDTPTDVLSFTSDEIDPETGSRYLGDIIISVERASAQAEAAGRPLDEELTMLIVHGCLHLSGLDHYSAEEKAIMQPYQESILESLCVSNYLWPVE